MLSPVGLGGFGSMSGYGHLGAGVSELHATGALDPLRWDSQAFSMDTFKDLSLALRYDRFAIEASRGVSGSLAGGLISDGPLRHGALAGGAASTLGNGLPFSVDSAIFATVNTAISGSTTSSTGDGKFASGEPRSNLYLYNEDRNSREHVTYHALTFWADDQLGAADKVFDANGTRIRGDLDVAVFQIEI
jgi:hypothetical protein